MKKTVHIPIFIPHMGCPHDCAFCNQKKITGSEAEVLPDDVSRRIEEALRTIGSGAESRIEAAFFGGSFTGIDIGLQEAYLKATSRFLGDIDGIRISTRPDYISRDILEMLVKYNVIAVELGVQSTDDYVLARNKRGHTYDDVIKASSMIKEYGMSLGLQMMVGMVGSSPEKDIKTAEDIITLRPDETRIYPSVVLKDTDTEQLFHSGDYVPYSVEEAVGITKDIVCRFERAGVAVLRIGLHADLAAGGSLVAGPYHPAFGELVRGEIWKDSMERDIIGKGLFGAEYVIEADKSEVSRIVGHKRSNRHYFKDKYDIDIKVNVK